MSHYNLIDEEWIPVIDLAGNLQNRCILDTLLNAEKYAAIEDQSPLVTASLYRFLLAILYRALKGPCDPVEAKKLFQNGLPLEKIRNYLNDWHERFWLFHDKYPFGQIAEFQPKTWRAWTALSSEHNADNAKVLFDHIGVNTAGKISLSQAVRWLLAKQTFALSAGKSELAHTGSSPSADVLIAIPIGKNLSDTLLFNLVPENNIIVQNDLTIWERSPETIEYLMSKSKKQLDEHDDGHTISRCANGIADLYTWRSRTILFQQDNESLVKDVGFASGVGYIASSYTDPMVGFQIKEVMNKETKVKEKKEIPIRFSEKGIWREFDSLLPDGGKLSPKVIENAVFLTRNNLHRYPISIMVLGQVNNKAKIEFWRMEKFVFPKNVRENKFIRNDFQIFLNEAENISKSIFKACSAFAKMMLSRGERKVENKDITSFIHQMQSLEFYWTELERDFNYILQLTLTTKEQHDPDQIHHYWLIAVRNALLSAWSLHEHSIDGTDPWALRAFVKANGIVVAKSKELQEMIEKLKPIDTTTPQEVV